MKRIVKGFLLAALLIGVPLLWARTTADNVALRSRGSRGTVTNAGQIVSISNLRGVNVTHSAVVSNDAAIGGGVLFVAADVGSASSSTMPTPPANIQSLGRVMSLNPGESLSLNQGVQDIGLRAETVDVAARVIVTFK